MVSQLRKRWVFVLVAFGAVILAVLGNTLLPVVARAYGNFLLKQGDLTAFASDVLDDGEVLHFTTTLSWRTDPSMSEPPDPYHLPVLHFYQGKRVTEKWITEEGFHEIERLVNHQDTIIGERVLTRNTFQLYDPISGLAVAFPREQTERTAPMAIQDASSIQVHSMQRVAESSWGRPAWLLEMDPLQASPDTFGSDPLTAQPYAFTEDLHFASVQEFRTLDTKTRLTIRRQLFALTADGPVLLWEQQNSRPEILVRSELSFDWDNFVIPEAQTLLAEQRRFMQAAGQFAGPRTVLFRKSGVALSELESVVGQVPTSPLVLLDPQTVRERVGLDSIQLDFASHEWPQCTHQGFAFTLSLCDAPVNITYASSHSPSDMQIQILQGPTHQIVPLLRQALPGWRTSQPITLVINGQTVQGWEMMWSKIKGLRSVMFEVQGTFVQIDFYTMSDQNLSALLEHLASIAGESVQHKQIYLPFLQR
ncbi:MAG: hypothetical protein D6694_11245 [Gammaproteobacteria bacterium]|nr:MAG: hypothetical protein D6694_11245 [Gammaproteobacteria bacterium]